MFGSLVMYVEYKRLLFAWLTFSIKFGGKQRWIVSSHQYSSRFFSVSWEMAPAFVLASFIPFALFRKKKQSENALKKPWYFFFELDPPKIDDVFKQSWKLVVSSLNSSVDGKTSHFEKRVVSIQSSKMSIISSWVRSSVIQN